MPSPFFKESSEYTRDFNIVKNYKIILAKHLALIKDVPLKETTAMVDLLLEKRHPPKSPELKVLQRKIRRDAKKGKTDLISYLKSIVDEKLILAPNLVAYANKFMEESYVSGFIRDNMTARSGVKKEGQAAKASGALEFANFCHILQANYKIRNNSISGATSSPYNPLYYRSAHTGLTSTCRVITTTANAVNEKMLASSRHYYSPDITLANISYIITSSDLGAIAFAQSKFGIATPTVEFVYAQILESTREYWESPRHEGRILTVLQNMSSVELTAVSLSGDLHAISRTNDKVLRQFYTEMLYLPEHPVADEEAVLATLDADTFALASMLSESFIKGKKTSDLKKEDPVMYSRYVARIDHVNKTLIKWEDFIRAFITTDIRPQNLNQLPTMIRKAVVASDTDSSISTTQNQVEWFTGTLKPGANSTAVAGVTAYLASQNIAHQIGLLCGQMGVAEDDLFFCTMKYEIFANTLAPCNVTKHYIMLETMEEGAMFKKSKLTVKGVNLKNSNLPDVIKTCLEKYQHTTMEYVEKGESITAQMIMSVPAYVEHCIIKALNEGDATYFRAVQIKTKDTYARAYPFRYVEFWERCFSAKYGKIDAIPVPCIRVQLNLPNVASIMKWADDLIASGEAHMGNAIKEHVFETEIKNMSSMVIPMDLIVDGKLPVEVLPVIDKRKILSSMMQPFYLSASLFGMHCLNKHFTNFFSDSFSMEDAKKHLMFEIDM